MARLAPPPKSFEEAYLPTATDAPSPKSFEEAYFPLKLSDAVKQGTRENPYDIVIVGTGMGGGVLAGALYDANQELGDKMKKRILVVERGGLLFHSHCLNTSRPPGLLTNRGQQNDRFYATFKDNKAWTIKTDGGAKDNWAGGPLYCLGGRSCVWGLFAPRPHVKSLKSHFPYDVCQDLHNKFFPKAEDLMKIYSPKTKPVHQALMDHLNMANYLDDTNLGEAGTELQWEWGRIASEFSDERNFDFAEGAYSTVDKLLEIAMTNKEKKDAAEKEGRKKKDAKFQIVLNAKVISLEPDQPDHKEMHPLVKVVFENCKDFTYSRRVVLCAGSVESAAILLRSPEILPQSPKIVPTINTPITDHNIYGVVVKFKYANEADRAKIGPMKLQTYFRFGNKNDLNNADKDLIAIANVTIDVASFLPRQKAPDNNADPELIVTFILPADLNKVDHIDATKSTLTVTIKREPNVKKRKDIMFRMVRDILKGVKEVLKLQIKDDPKETDLVLLPLGAVAHELGSLPMPGGSEKSEAGHEAVVDENLNVIKRVDKRADKKGTHCKQETWPISVCDLSVFPFSPAANPSLTLAALALRLAYQLGAEHGHGGGHMHVVGHV